MKHEIAFTISTIYKVILSGLMFISLVSIYSVPSSANSFPHVESFSISNINEILLEQFPYVKSYAGAEVTFSGPELVILPLDNQIEIKVKITASMDQKVMSAKGVLVGNVVYRNVDDTIILKSPMLERIFTESSDMDDPLPVLKIIKQTLSHQFRDIDLIKLDSLEFIALSNEPSEIKIGIDKIMVRWH